MKNFETCKNCGASVLASRMADHWLIARHHSRSLPATRAAAADAPMSRGEVMRAFHKQGNALEARRIQRVAHNDYRRMRGTS